MAFGQRVFLRFDSWGVALGYGEERPSAKLIYYHRLVLRCKLSLRTLYWRFERGFSVLLDP